MAPSANSRAHLKKAREQTMFLAGLAEGMSVVAAAEAANVGRTALYSWRRDDTEFAAAWEEAYEHGTDLLEAEAQRRAVEGVEKAVTVAGEREIVREYSDTLLIFLLKARRPQRFRDNARVEVTGAGGGPIRTETEDRSASLADVLAVIKEAIGDNDAGAPDKLG